VDNENRTQFRGVTQYAVTKQHDASDAAMTGGKNRIDSEMQYYLNQTFNPWDLNEAVHKDSRRWLEWKNVGGGTSLTTKAKPVIVVPATEWDAYCNYAERVINMSSGKLLSRLKGEYTFTLNADGTATIGGLNNNMKYKILYSTRATYSLADLLAMTFTVNDTSVSATPPYNIVSMNDAKQQSWTDPLGMQWVFRVDDINLAATLNTGNDYTVNYTTVLTRDLNGWETNFVVRGVSYPASNTYTGSWDFQNLAPLSNNNVSVAISMVDIHWMVTNPTLQDLIVSQLGFTATLSVNVTYVYNSDTGGNYTLLTATLDANPASQYAGMLYMYTENQMGRYEWINIGRDAATVDSAGSALVAEAFDSLKKVQIGIAGSDLEASDAANRMPWVMANFATGTSVAAYKDSLLRAALRDDFCTYWPVASSNMIGVGGPLANLFAYYANDWTDAFYGLEQFAGTAYANKIVPITCWNRNWPGYTYNTYNSSSNTGYAVIATHKDINGTVLFTVWGHWGRDTYYASLWLHGDEARGLEPGIIELQRAPNGVTSIILKIDYTNPYHPTYTIPEVLGTISERLWTDIGAKDVTNPYKGGIHDP
ncbi:MAG: hypothetical protein NWE94_05265, partial [Candidatus Bathyarchaeota archaeon]|nr:hypothetical protein [Candidatus Bathyarchaeota archaeon]